MNWLQEFLASHAEIMELRETAVIIANRLTQEKRENAKLRLELWQALQVIEELRISNIRLAATAEHAEHQADQWRNRWMDTP